VLKLKSYISEIKYNTKPVANQIELLWFVEVIYIGIWSCMPNFTCSQ